MSGFFSKVGHHFKNLYLVGWGGGGGGVGDNEELVQKIVFFKGKF
jgi:hypothetical protein